jgi:class 3 adenylate cyclase
MTTLHDELAATVNDTFAKQWTRRDGRKVPEPGEIKLGNDAVKLQATVLYADLADSTGLVNKYPATFAAEVYKTYLYCAAKIIRSLGGVITAYDGDRVMAVFVGDNKNTVAAECGLKINHAVQKIVQPALEKQYPERKSFKIRQKIGVDSSELFVAQTGIRGSNDLVWVGKAANYAAKMAALSASYSTYISETVYKRMNKSSRISNGGRNMWTQLSNRPLGLLYGSNWTRPI